MRRVLRVCCPGSCVAALVRTMSTGPSSMWPFATVGWSAAARAGGGGLPVAPFAGTGTTGAGGAGSAAAAAAGVGGAGGVPTDQSAESYFQSVDTRLHTILLWTEVSPQQRQVELVRIWQELRQRHHSAAWKVPVSVWDDVLNVMEHVGVPALSHYVHVVLMMDMWTLSEVDRARLHRLMDALRMLLGDGSHSMTPETAALPPRLLAWAWYALSLACAATQQMAHVETAYAQALRVDMQSFPR
jgi:hypothetical protein